MIRRVVARTLNAARRLVVAVVGFTVVLLGLALIVRPGPAVAVIPIGLVLLATEFVWARRLLQRMKAEANGLAPSPGVKPHLETELRHVEDRLRATTARSTRASSGQRDTLASADTETVDESRDRLLTRRANLQAALRRLHEGGYGQCASCHRPISEGRLRVMPEATLCVRCPERRERSQGATL